MISIKGLVGGDEVHFKFEGKHSCFITLEKLTDFFDLKERCGCPEHCGLCDYVQYEGEGLWIEKQK